MGSENPTLQADSEGDKYTTQEHGINLCWHSPNILVEVLQQTFEDCLKRPTFRTRASSRCSLTHERYPMRSIPTHANRNELL
ncbi:hypothetical protein PGT21_020271 [Puccinia graminis f. sp. tritici]|uniref:Uncharacterized protein n=1 Tax=Puccinia graminis f. sp. tritici TaxID=56615 RepID=A0A5B0REI8_PUCGR|nr:hypothetical protein PGT21_004920 [Puccinia graminis f. sp. tritici]KAA1092990.1 hypothetical protein PGT21_020271 [Puccinia graminis f. sp. tritici]KAA1115680.1 hypothetical protein PGTUg99_025047 [Puccinia graminis f. sp. tritici]KAA1123315.1 hypothetical protein PGTUg99_003904 [Puccinia graminis f. sp. tritici]KAA1130071.1 hypothetical protein PGTUg99_006165 [Puccinia graminis f. sp. tritici]